MKFDIYDGDDVNRFVLGKAGAKPIVIFGINPSTANQRKSDRTIEKVEKLVKVWNFDGFLMFNLYPLRTSNPNKLPKTYDVALSKSNAQKVRAQLLKFNTSVIWAAWGNAFDLRSYFKDCLERIFLEIKDLNLRWNRCESFTKTQNPRHPLSGQPHIITERSLLSDFDVEEYLRLKK